MTINPGDTQTIQFYNAPISKVEFIKVDEANRSVRIPDTTIEVRRLDGALVTTLVTSESGQAFAQLEDGSYYAVETVANPKYQLDSKVVYKTNLSEDYRTLADNLSTSKVYVLDARPAVLSLAANERVTEIMFVFGNVRAGFAQVETPYIYATARSGLANNSSIVNVADVGGLYDGQWIQAVSRWLTTIYAKTTVRLPKTGY